MIFDTDSLEFTNFAVKYDVEAVISKMKKMKYPKLCIDYYDTKARL